MKRFNLYELTSILNHVALSHPLVNTVLNDRYSLNATDNVLYPAVIFVKNNMQIGTQLSTASFSVIYVDRLTAERDNSIHIHSVGTQVISEIMNVLYDNFDIDPANETIAIEYFKDGYADNVAGAISNDVSFRFKSDIGECYDYCINDCYNNCGNE